MEEVMISAPVEKKTRNQTYEFFKGIACILVVITHCNFPGSFGQIIATTFCRWMVPFFLVVAGYFYRKDGLSYCLGKAKHLLILCVYASLFHCVVTILEHLIKKDLYAYAISSFTVRNLIKFVTMNQPIFITGITWYLFAMLWMYLSYAVMIKLRLVKIEHLICVALFAGYFFLSYGVYWLTGKRLDTYFYRNFLFDCLPFFLLGKWIYQITKGFTDQQKEKYSKIGIWLVMFGFCFKYLETAVVGRDFYGYQLGAIVVVIGIMLFALVDRIPKSGRLLCELGGRYSLLVYVIHPAVFLALDLFMEYFAAAGMDSFGYRQMRPILTVVLTILVAVAFEEMKSMWKKRKAVDAVQNAATCS